MAAREPGGRIHILDGGARPVDRSKGKASVVGIGVTGRQLASRNAYARDSDGISHRDVGPRGIHRHRHEIASFADRRDARRLTRQGRCGYWAKSGCEWRLSCRVKRGNTVDPARNTTRTGDIHSRIIGKNGGMRGHNAEVGRARIGSGSFRDDRVSRNVNLQGSARVVRRVGADGKDSVEICRNGRGLHRTPGNSVLRAGNDHGTVDLATRHHQQGGNHHGRQSAHTSKTHQHPKGKVLVTRF